MKEAVLELTQLLGFAIRVIEELEDHGGDATPAKLGLKIALSRYEKEAKRMKHRYSDNCICEKCEATFRKAVLDAINRSEKLTRKKRHERKGKGSRSQV